MKMGIPRHALGYVLAFLAGAGAVLALEVIQSRPGTEKGGGPATPKLVDGRGESRPHISTPISSYTRAYAEKQVWRLCMDTKGAHQPDAVMSDQCAKSARKIIDDMLQDAGDGSEWSRLGDFATACYAQGSSAKVELWLSDATLHRQNRRLFGANCEVRAPEANLTVIWQWRQDGSVSELPDMAAWIKANKETVQALSNDDRPLPPRAFLQGLQSQGDRP